MVNTRLHVSVMISTKVPDEGYYEIFPLQASCTKRGPHQQLHFGGQAIWLYRLSFPMLLILHQFKT